MLALPSARLLAVAKMNSETLVAAPAVGTAVTALDLRTQWG